MSWYKVANTTDIPEGQMVQVMVEDEPIAVYHTSEGFYATSDICTHAGQTLTLGKLEGCIVACPKHGGKFDVQSGEAVQMPCVVPVETFAVDIRGEAIYIDFE